MHIAVKCVVNKLKAKYDRDTRYQYSGISHTGYKTLVCIIASDVPGGNRILIIKIKAQHSALSKAINKFFYLNSVFLMALLKALCWALIFIIRTLVCSLCKSSLTISQSCYYIHFIFFGWYFLTALSMCKEPVAKYSTNGQKKFIF